MTVQLELTVQPPSQRHSPASVAAGREMESPAETLRGMVLERLRAAGERGATDEELQRGLCMNPSTERPRRIELVRLGRVTDSGLTRPTLSGRSATVWRAC